MSVHALILDFGEVLARAQSRAALERMAHLAGFGVPEFVERYWRYRLDYDGGLLSDTEYWRRVTGRDEGTDETLRRLAEADADSWADYREDVWAMAAEARARGLRTAMLSNAVPAVFGRISRDKVLADYFDVLVASFQEQCVKPDPRIYRICLERLGVAAERALFVDDRTVNIDAAGRLGLQVCHFTGDESVGVLRTMLGW